MRYVCSRDAIMAPALTKFGHAEKSFLQAVSLSVVNAFLSTNISHSLALESSRAKVMFLF